MNPTSPPRPTGLDAYCVRLTTGPAAAAEARSQVRAAICAWQAPVDPDVAVLLASDLVTNVLRFQEIETVTLALRCARGRLHVEVHSTSPLSPAVAGTPVEAATGPGLILVATLSDEWGSYRTTEGKAVYFSLAFQPDLAKGGGRDPGECGSRQSPEPL